MQAGLDGIRFRRTIEAKNPRPLPDSVAAALTLFESSEAAAEWMGADLHSAFGRFKRAEIQSLEHLEESEICRRYAEVY